MSISKNILKKITGYLWEIPESYRHDMKVPARLYASEKMLDEISRDRSLEQLVNVTTLPGIQKYAIAMPDAHEGYGFPIGGIAATEYPDGVISPGGIGYDINCGIRLLRSDLHNDEIRDKIEELAKKIYKEVPSGVGKGGQFKLSAAELDRILKNGVQQLVDDGHALPEDLEFIESNGKLDNAEPSAVSDHAKKRGKDQLGTMGAGNHFVEIDRVDEVFNETAADALGLYPDQVVVLIHTGSRGLGHQIATDYIRQMIKTMPKYGIKLPDRELACAPLSSPEGKNYFNAMACAANFAWSNRQMITYEIRNIWQKIFGNSSSLDIVYDVAHNIAKIEKYDDKKLIIHRKGATRAFGPGQPEIVKRYRPIGQPVLIPGSMGTASFVLIGTEKAMEESFGSSCHGAGRRMSRHKAKKTVRGENLLQDLKRQGITVQAGSMPGLAEEAPIAYKDVENVVDTVQGAGIAKKVARLKPVAVIKG